MDGRKLDGWQETRADRRTSDQPIHPITYVISSSKSTSHSTPAYIISNGLNVQSFSLVIRGRELKYLIIEVLTEKRESIQSLFLIASVLRDLPVACVPPTTGKAC